MRRASQTGRTQHWGLRASPKRTPIVTLELLGFRTHTFHIFNSGALGGFPCPLTPIAVCGRGPLITICFIRGGDAYRGPTLQGRGAASEKRTGRVRGGGVGGRRPGRGNLLTYSRHDERRQPSTKNGVNHTRRGSSLPTRRARNTSEKPALVASKAAPSWPNNSRGRNRGSRGGGRGKRLCGERAWAESRGTTRAQL